MLKINSTVLDSKPFLHRVKLASTKHCISYLSLCIVHICEVTSSSSVEVRS